MEGWFCRKHPKYAVKRIPRAACEVCWWLWFSKHLGRLRAHPDLAWRRRA